MALPRLSCKRRKSWFAVYSQISAAKPAARRFTHVVLHAGCSLHADERLVSKRVAQTSTSYTLTKNAGPQKTTTLRILQTMISGIPLILGLTTRM